MMVADISVETTVCVMKTVDKGHKLPTVVEDVDMKVVATLPLVNGGLEVGDPTAGVDGTLTAWLCGCPDGGGAPVPLLASDGNDPGPEVGFPEVGTRGDGEIPVRELEPRTPAGGWDPRRGTVGAPGVGDGTPTGEFAARGEAAAAAAASAQIG